MTRFVAFDVETPNRLNHRMSAIGIAVVEDGDIVEEFYSLVNPETYFEYFNQFTLTYPVSEKWKFLNNFHYRIFVEIWKFDVILLTHFFSPFIQACYDFSIWKD